MRGVGYQVLVKIRLNGLENVCHRASNQRTLYNATYLVYRDRKNEQFMLDE